MEPRCSEASSHADYLVAPNKWWLRRFRFSPVEWLWRTLTYGKLQPMRVQHG